MRSRRAASEEVTTPPSSVMNSRRFIRPPIPHSGRCRRLLSALEFAIGVIPKLADPDSSCVNSSGTSIAKKYSGPMRYGHSAQAPTLAKMSQALRSLVLRTGQTWRIWRDELLASTRPPFPTGSDACFIAYYASAELGTFCALNWSKPHNIIDLFAE